jgi:glucose-1-phosphate thymidylyltransferase
MKVIILAAGYATRLYPLTKHKPKALLPIGNKPLINHLIDKMDRLEDLNEIILVTNDRFYQQFLDWSKTIRASAPVTVINDGTTDNDNRLGAVGDLQFAVKASKTKEDIMVLASDNLFDEDFKGFTAFAKKKGDGLSIGVYDIGDPKIAAGRYGIIEFDSTKKITRIEEKPKEPKATTVSMGVYYFSQSTLPFMDIYMKSSAKQDAPGHYVTWLLKQMNVYAYLFSGKWYDIGSFDQLDEANRDYQGKS